MIQIVCSHHNVFAAHKLNQETGGGAEIVVDHYSTVPYLSMFAEGQQVGTLDVAAIKLRESQCPTCHRPWKDAK